MPELFDHLLGRILGDSFNGDEREFTARERMRLRIDKDRLYFHQTLRVNYTTYDMRRDQDSINPRTHPDVMLYAHEDDIDPDDVHPYWYARVIGIYHAYISYDGPNADGTGTLHLNHERVEFLWVRWLGRDMQNLGGFDERRLHLVGFIDNGDTAPVSWTLRRLSAVFI